MKVTIVEYEDLPEDVRYSQPDNGCGKEDANYLKIEIPGVSVYYQSDAMEPEDATFTRDLSWIVDELHRAYVAGMLDAWLFHNSPFNYTAHTRLA